MSVLTTEVGTGVGTGTGSDVDPETTAVMGAVTGPGLTQGPPETLPDELSVSQAASLLGLTTRRVRQLIDHGTLSARRSGGQWSVPTAAAQKLAEKRSVGAGGAAIGRPFSFMSAWALLSEHHRHLTGQPLRDLAPALTRSDVSRARARLADLHLPGGGAGALDTTTRARLSRLLDNRAVVIHAWTSPWDLDELQNSALLAPTGASRGRIRRGRLDAYVCVSDLYGMNADGTAVAATPGAGGLWGAHQLKPAEAQGANLRLRLLPDPAFSAAARESLTHPSSLLLAVDRT